MLIFQGKTTKLLTIILLAVISHISPFQITTPCFAQVLQEIPENLPNKNNSLSFNGLMQVDTILHNTQNKNEPSFNGKYAQAGVIAQKGIVTGKLTVNFIGNQPYTQKVKQEPVANTNKYSTSSNGSSGISMGVA